MDQHERAETLYRLFELINFYYEERDRPIRFDFFKDLESCCEQLDFDVEEVKAKFGIAGSSTT